MTFHSQMTKEGIRRFIIYMNNLFLTNTLQSGG
jgi:hypothetical protein